jgi:hypothetical protein
MTTDTIARWHRIVKSRDTSGLDDLLAEDAVSNAQIRGRLRPPNGTS